MSFRKFLLPLFLAAAIIAMMLPGSLVSIDTRSFYYLWESGHLVLFFLGWHLIYTFYPQLSGLSFFRQLAILLGTTLVSVVLLEGLQSALSGKSLSVSDILGDIAGALLFLSYRYRQKKKSFYCLHGAALFLACLVLLPIFRSIIDEVVVRDQFPLLADFETPLEKSRFEEGNIENVLQSSEQAFHGRRSLRLSLLPGPWSGVTMRYFPSAWQDYTLLHFAVYNPGSQPVSLEFWIEDAIHEQEKKPRNDLFRRIILLPAGRWTQVQYSFDEIRKGPLSREMDLAHITGLGFFVGKERSPLTLYLDAIWLE